MHEDRSHLRLCERSDPEQNFNEASSRSFYFAHKNVMLISHLNMIE